MLKKLLGKYISLVKRIPERHYWPLFIILSLYFVIPYSEFVVTLGALGYFKFEKSYRKVFVIKYGGSVIFFLVMLDDTLFYAAIILAALWTGREVKKSLPQDQDHATLDKSATDP